MTKVEAIQLALLAMNHPTYQKVRPQLYVGLQTVSIRDKERGTLQFWKFKGPKRRRRRA